MINLNISDAEAEQLYHTQMGCFYWKQKCQNRFEIINDDIEELDSTIYKDADGTMEWCENFTNALILKNYRIQIDKETACILWDTYQENYLVLSTKKWN